MSRKLSPPNAGQGPPPMPDSVMKQAREYLGYSRSQIARRFGLSSRDVARWETGRAKPDPNQMRILSALYRRSVADLLKPGPDDVGPLPANLQEPAKGLPIEDRMELTMFARFLRYRKEAAADSDAWRHHEHD